MWNTYTKKLFVYRKLEIDVLWILIGSPCLLFLHPDLFSFTEKSQNGRQKEIRLAPKQMELRVVGLFPNLALKKKKKQTLL